MAPSVVRQDRQRADALRHRRLGVEIQLTDQAGDSEPGIALDGDAGMGPHPTFAPRHRQSVLIELRTRLLAPVPCFTGELQEPEVVLLEHVGLDRGLPPLAGRWRQVSRRCEVHGVKDTPSFSTAATRTKTRLSARRVCSANKEMRPAPRAASNGLPHRGELRHACTMAYWSVAQLEAKRERLAQHCLELAGYVVYAPRIAVATSKARRTTALLFPNYAFVQIEASWWHARWAPGVLRLILSGDVPARVPDKVISELRGRERNGLVVLPRKSAAGPRPFAPGDKLRVRSGPFTGLSGLYAGQAPHERVLVLLAMLGSQARVELPAASVVRA